MADEIDALKLTSLFLQYPSASLQEAAASVPDVRIAGRRRRDEERLRSFCSWYASRPLGELQRLYVDAFDFTKGCSLHLTYHVHGDRRQRGLAMLELKEAYRGLGFEPPGDELPDYLPLMLEFAALAPGGAGRDLLEDNRVSIELVRGALRRDDSPFAPLLEVVVAGLGRLSGAEARADPAARRRGPARRGGGAGAVRAAGGDADRRPRAGAADGRRLGGDVSRGPTLLYAVLPYAALAIFVVGHLWRYRTDQYGWGARSTQLLESRVLKYASTIFHFGVLAAIGGHVLGLLVPRSWTAAVGLNDDAYHVVAVIGGRRRRRRRPDRVRDARLPATALPAGPGDDDARRRGRLRPARGRDRHRAAGDAHQHRRRRCTTASRSRPTSATC